MAVSNIGLRWTLGDRLAKARRAAGIQVQEMADVFGVTRNTIYTWEHDAVEIKASTVGRWAEVTGASVAWLYDEAADTNGDGPYRAPAAGAAALPLPVRTADPDEATETSVRRRVSEKTSPPLLVTSSHRNESNDPCRNTECTVHHAEPGDKAA